MLNKKSSKFEGSVGTVGLGLLGAGAVLAIGSDIGHWAGKRGKQLLNTAMVAETVTSAVESAASKKEK